MEKEIEDLITKLTDDFEKSVSEEEKEREEKEKKEREELIDAFEKHMYFAVKTLQESESKFIQKDTESVKSVLKRMAKNLSEEDIDSKKRELLKDEAFEEIRKTSVEIFEMAKNKMDGKKVKKDKDLEDKINNLDDMFEKVQEYNKKRAKTLISEAQIDSRYIADENEGTLSLRLYHYSEKKEKMEGKK